MFFDALTMACVADELRAALLEGRVQQALLPDRLSVGLEIYAGRQRRYLLASAHPEQGRLLLSATKLRRGVDKETGLLLLLRKYLRGATLSAIHWPPFERVLRLQFDHPEWGCTELVVEVMGRYSNVILVGPGNRVLDAVKRIGPDLSPTRPVLPGQPYSPPPPQPKIAPSELTEYRLRQMLVGREADAPVWQALVAGLRGVSPLLAREIAFRALGQPRATMAQVDRLTPLLETVRALLAPLENGCWQPAVVLEGGRPAAYAPYLVGHRGQAQPMPSISQAIEAYIESLPAAGDPYAAAKRPVREALASARARLERRQQALERALAQAEAADQWRQWGEWILAYAHAIIPGQAELIAETGGEPLGIPLDTERSPVENAQAYFARYRKAQRAAEGVPARLEQVRLALRDLEQLDTDLALAASRPEIDQVRAALVEAGHVRVRGGRPATRKAGPGQPLSLVSPDGLPILVGRNSRQNDELTFRRADSDDWWFHARGVPGAHVIVRAVGADLPPATLRRAAELAAAFSRLREERAVDVDYTRRRYVRRIPGAAPGLVTYSQEQTVRVAPVGAD